MYIILFAILVVAAVYVVGSWTHQRDWDRVKLDRSGDSIDTFLSSYEYDPEVKSLARTAYEVIQKDFFRDRFPLRPSDRIEDTLLIYAEELDELVEVLLSRYGLSLEDALSVKERLPIVTVDDLIKLIAFLKKLPEPPTNRSFR